MSFAEKKKHGSMDAAFEAGKRKMNIEDTVCSDLLPSNSKAMINRLTELLDEHKTNCLQFRPCQDDTRVRKVMWLLMSQVFGQMATIEMSNLWDELCADEIRRRAERKQAERLAAKTNGG